MPTSAAARDWSKLLPELLGIIARRLTLVDYVRFGAVCTSWLSSITMQSATGRRLHRPKLSQVPWLMLAGEEADSSCDTLGFISLPDGVLFKVSPLPELENRWWIGANNGFLVTLDPMTTSIQLFNPLTREQINLPPVTTFQEVEAVRDADSGAVTMYRVRNSEGGICGLDEDEIDLYTPLEFRIYFFGKVIFSSDNPRDAMAIVRPRHDLAFAKAGGEEEWTILATPGHYQDIIYWKGKFLAVNSHADVQVWDLSGGGARIAMIIWNNNSIYRSYTSIKKYIIESSGELYLVWRDGDNDENGEYRTNFIQVMQLCGSERDWKWVRVDGLGDRSFFLGGNESVCLTVGEVPELRGNCIFFTDDCWCSFFDGGHMLTRDMGMYNMADGTYMPYFPRGLQINWPFPIWFTPRMY